MIFFRTLLLGFILNETLLANIGRVTAIRGDVKITRGIALYQAHKNLEIEEKDTFFTSKNGSMQITFSDNSVITLGKNSIFKVEEYLYNEKHRKSNKAKFKFRKGFFKSITGRIGKLAPKNFAIKTKNSTIGVRGTEITGISTQTDENIVCTHGEIEVTALSTNKKYIAKANEQIKIKLDPKVDYLVATTVDVLIQNQIKEGIKEKDDKEIAHNLKEEILIVIKPKIKKEMLKKGIKINPKTPILPKDTVTAPQIIKDRESETIEENFLLDKPEFKTQPELRKEIEDFTKELSAEDLAAIEKAKEAERIAKEEEAKRFYLAEKERVRKQQEALEAKRNTYKANLPKNVPNEKVSTKKEALSKDINKMDQLLDNMHNRF